MEDTSKKQFHLFNCDNTYKLAPVEALLSEMKDKGKLSFDISIEPHYFDLPSMSEVCDSKIPELQMDVAVFVVQAHESRLSINEENAGIGYAKIYRALREKTGDNVIIVIGADDNYKDEDEENKAVLSRWAWRKVASQFDEEYLDGRKSFIFSWDKKHREIHEEALLHFFDPNKKGQKFVPLPKMKKPTQYDISSFNEADVTTITTTSGMGEVEIVNELEEEPGKKQGSAAAEYREQDTTVNKSQNAAAEVSTAGSRLNYPEGTVLLDTKLQYGELSYEVDDLVKREESWYPPQEIRQTLQRNYKSTPEAQVKLVVRQNTVFQKVNVIRHPWWRFWRWQCTML